MGFLGRVGKAGHDLAFGSDSCWGDITKQTVWARWDFLFRDSRGNENMTSENIHGCSVSDGGRSWFGFGGSGDIGWAVTVFHLVSSRELALLAFSPYQTRNTPFCLFLLLWIWSRIHKKLSWSVENYSNCSKIMDCKLKQRKW